MDEAIYTESMNEDDSKDYQPDYLEVLQLLKKTRKNKRYTRDSKYLPIIWCTEYLVAKSLYFHSIPYVLIAGIINAEDVQEMISGIDDFLNYIFKNSGSKVELNLSLIEYDLIAKDFFLIFN